MVRLIAETVCDRMGGVIDKWKVSTMICSVNSLEKRDGESIHDCPFQKSIHTEDLEIASLQKKYQSVAIPITMIQNGAYKCRSILFKAMADSFKIPCTLERGDFHKMWNVVSLRIKTVKNNIHILLFYKT